MMNDLANSCDFLLRRRICYLIAEKIIEQFRIFRQFFPHSLCCSTLVTGSNFSKRRAYFLASGASPLSHRSLCIIRLNVLMQFSCCTMIPQFFFFSLLYFPFIRYVYRCQTVIRKNKLHNDHIWYIPYLNLFTELSCNFKFVPLPYRRMYCRWSHTFR